jgi:hypothetical protein
MKLPHRFSLEQITNLIKQGYEKHTIRVSEVECLVVEVDGVQCVIPRGTEASKFFSGGGWRDVLRDMRFYVWKDHRVGWSHAGFVKGARGIVDRGLFGLLDRSKPIALYGHSLGGAVAINAAKMLHWHGFDVIEVVTVGAPRTLTKSSAKSFKLTGIQITEYSNDGDPIPRLPPRGMIFRYVHINEIMTNWKCDHNSIKVITRIKENHSLTSYIEALV